MSILTTRIQKAIDRRCNAISKDTTAYRLVNGAGDTLTGLVVDRLGDFILIQSATDPQREVIDFFYTQFPKSGVYFKRSTPLVRGKSKTEIGAQHILGPKAPKRFPVLENGLTFLLSLDEGYSYGIFLDQRDNRRHILEMNLKGKTVLNTFAYTCAFSVCAAKAGAIVTSLDLSKKYLGWGRDNFRANTLDDNRHDFIFGDVFDWLPRLAKKGRRWDLVILDPPTFSTIRSGDMFQLISDYPKLLKIAHTLLVPGGNILACMNAHNVSTRQFNNLIRTTVPNPASPEFPNLKSAWITYRAR